MKRHGKVLKKLSDVVDDEVVKNKIQHIRDKSG